MKPLKEQILGVLEAGGQTLGSVCDELEDHHGDVSNQDVKAALDDIVQEGCVRPVGVLYQLAKMDAPRPVPPPVEVATPQGVDLIRAVVAFHADIQEELASSKLEFDPTDEVHQELLHRKIKYPVDWYALTQPGDVEIRRDHLPQMTQAHGKRVFFCGPMELVRQRKGGLRWFPVFIIPARAHNLQQTVRFTRDGDLRINLEWLRAYSRDPEECTDLLVRLGFLEHQEAPHDPTPICQNHLGHCWNNLLDDCRSMALDDRIREGHAAMDPVADIDLLQQKRPGIYGRVLLIEESLSSFSKGLVEDLRKIAQASEDQLLGSALSMLLPGHRHDAVSQPIGLGDGPQVHESQLNPSQERAVDSALRNPWTVVEGPPGTGKSTMVRSALLSVATRGGSAIFASSNHKAVDAVTEDWNQQFDGDQRLIADLRPRDGTTPKWPNIFLANHASTAAVGEGDIQALLTQLEGLDARYKELDAEVAHASALRDCLGELQEEQDGMRRSCDSVWLERAQEWSIPMSLERAVQVLKSSRKAWWHPMRWIGAWSRRGLVRALQRQCPEGQTLEVIDVETLLRAKDLQQRLELAEAEARGLRDVHACNQELFEITEQRVQLTRDALPCFPGMLMSRGRDAAAGVQSIRDARRAPALELLHTQHFRKALRGLPLWAITNKSVKRAVPHVAGAFDLAVIDEAAQCDVSSVLPVLFRARRAMFVGDEKQLPPLDPERVAVDLEDSLLRKRGLSDDDCLKYAFRRRSAYKLAESLQAEGVPGILLDEHYRCHPEIAEFFSETYYDDKLVIRTSRDGEDYAGLRGIRWSHVTGDNQTPGPRGQSRWDRLQAQRIREALVRLHEDGYRGTVGVVSPFHYHAKKIRDDVERRIPRERLDEWQFLSDTVDKFQGGEKDIILVGIVGGGANGTPRFYKGEGAERRFNVAFSRARHLLHVFADQQWAAESGVKVLEALASHVREIEDQQPTGNHDPIRKELIDPLRKELIGPVWEPALAKAMRDVGLKCQQQYHACGFYLDFALFPGGGRKVNVEVDGERYRNVSMIVRQL